MLLKTIRDPGDTRFKGSQIYAFTHTQHFTAYMIIRESQKSCLLNKAKARKECGALIPTKIQVLAMIIMYNNHYTIKVSSKNIHSPLTPVDTDIRERQTN